ncbi:cytochrome bd ubiquinol oxidase subunit I [Novosphingobium nitrogenifigens DSM 19370]|uniref:Cytochrome bd ubiquinol oxidase subunit I n=1 Tax=Novosphingobium nitrogenifigens DSM 19370 TaxID=983920 RepID=F1Z609_9SPHN|nr:cytochrome ubiquinol oxidase subunit I [Novosphingobium nitrogenifigens]EGD59973.1 cytochrome bd ubiquinol oxidase subunit I [Novosphingobium nitrogenifigens DSM 19370]
MDMAVIELSRLQFALTALYHFLFVPLTLGLSFMLVIMESIYVITKRPIWRVITRFWGKLFGINFVLGVATGLTMEFEFGMNWAYYAHYVGDIFGAPLAIEGLMAFFLEATMVGVMFFGWDKLGRVQHLLVTFLVALGTNLSALWILIANGWMQNPVGATFNPDTMRMEVSNFGDVLFNPVAQAKFVHTVSAGYVCAATFVMGVSAYYLLRGKWTNVARRSMMVASAFGLAASLSVVVLGDESGYTLTDNQKMKLAAIEAMWKTEEAPAAITVFGLPDIQARTTHFAVEVPYVMGLIGTRSLTGKIDGIEDLVLRADSRIRSGVIAYDAVQKLKVNRNDVAARAVFEEHKRDIGYALLLKRYVSDPRQATNEQIMKAAADTIPNVPVLFFLFRIMAGIGFLFIAYFAAAFWCASACGFRRNWFLRLATFMLPLPWIAIEFGWMVAEIGRQPWSVDGVLPTFLGASSLTVPQVWATIIGFTALYGSLAVIEVRLMLASIRKGPVEHAPDEVAHEGPFAPLPAE